MKIEPVADAVALAAVHATSFEAPWTSADIATLLASPGAFALAASEADDPHGFILARAIAGEAEILTLAVDSAFRRQGLARALVEAAVGVAVSLAAETLFLEVAADNPAAIALYLGAGFIEVGRRRGYYARPDSAQIDALVMRRDLNRSAG